MAARRAAGTVLAEQLGVVGWKALDPVLLAALALEAPVLIVGVHGTAKSMLVERVAAALGLRFRHYNASLLNYDDLVGIPLPQEESSALRFVGTEGAIWDAEFVLVDEISRCRADLQNKLFPIVHERRVAGLDLRGLRHRWAAMNPPSSDAADGTTAGAQPTYLGSEPLDPALCDRFPFVVRAPGWNQLSKAEKQRVIAGPGHAGHEPPGAGWLPALVESTRRRRPAFEGARSKRLVDYVMLLLAGLEKADLPQSPRRARMLFDAIGAVHAARCALGSRDATPDDPALEESVLLAVRNGLPQSASEVPPAPATVLAAHRHAWEVSGLAQDDAWRQVLEEPDPVERVALGDRLGMADGDVARLVTQALAAQDDDARRVGLATAMFLSFRERRDLTPAAWEPLARHAVRVLEPRRHTAAIAPGPQMEKWREISAWTSRLEPGRADALVREYVLAGFPDLWQGADWKRERDRFRDELQRFGVIAR